MKRHGFYKDNPENRKLNRAGQEYGEISNEKLRAIKLYLFERTNEELKEIIKNGENRGYPLFIVYHANKELENRHTIYGSKKKYREIQRKAAEEIQKCGGIHRLGAGTEKGRIGGGQRNVEASILLGGNERGGNKTGRKNLDDQRRMEEKQIKEFSQFAGWFFSYSGLVKRWIKELKGGKESEVGVIEMGGKEWVCKITDYKVKEKTPLSFINNHISLHNTLFPDTNYTLYGITEKKGEFRFILLQPYIKGKTLEEIEYEELERYVTKKIPMSDIMRELDDYMENVLGMEKIENAECANEYFTVTDLHAHNVMRDGNGKFYFIDTNPYPNRKQ
ncbi:MAG: hypothetical protein LBL57_05215 [Tannerella sp.]|nr:hypothetical protein [Tannerella sp.]